jgi:tetratricopeptide (TPR) repeat protein
MAEPVGLAGFLAMQGDFDEARRRYRHGVAMYEDLGRQLIVAVRTIIGGAIEVLADDLAAAERELRRGIEMLEAMGEKNILSTVAGHLARVLYAQGRYAEAEELAEMCAQAAAEDDVISQVLWRSARGMVLARRDDFAEAERLAREAVALMEQTDQIDRHADALIDLAEVLRLSGREHEAAPVIEEALQLYERKENVVSTEKAKALLDELTREAAAP